MPKTATGSVVALVAGGLVYYLADTMMALSLIVILLLGAVAFFDQRLDEVSSRIDAILHRLYENR